MLQPKLTFKPNYNALTYLLPDGYQFTMMVKYMHADSREEIGRTSCLWGNPEGPEPTPSDRECNKGIINIGTGTAIQDSFGRWIPGDYIAEVWMDQTMFGSHAFRVYQVDYATDCWPGAGNTRVFERPVYKKHKADMAALGMPISENYKLAKNISRHLSNACYAYGNRNAD